MCWAWKNINLLKCIGRECGNVGMWRLGNVGIGAWNLEFEDVEMWRCGDVRMWKCGNVEMWECGNWKLGNVRM